MAWCLAMSPAGAVGRSVPWDAGRSAGVQSWQDYAVVRSPASDSGKISPRCVFGRRSVAAFSLHAFPKGPRTEKTPVRGNISPPCIQNELASARYSRHASEKPRKRAFGDTPREDLAKKGPFSLRGPLKSCTARGSCHAPTAPNSAGASGGRDMPQPQWHPWHPPHGIRGIGDPETAALPSTAERISSSLQRNFALLHRKRAPTIHIYPPYPWRSFPADAPRTAAFPATQANIETRRALAVVHWAESACHQHFVNAKSTAIFEHDSTRLKAAIPPEPR